MGIFGRLIVIGLRAFTCAEKTLLATLNDLASVGDAFRANVWDASLLATRSEVQTRLLWSEPVRVYFPVHRRRCWRR